MTWRSIDTTIDSYNPTRFLAIWVGLYEWNKCIYGSIGFQHTLSDICVGSLGSTPLHRLLVTSGETHIDTGRTWFVHECALLIRTFSQLAKCKKLLITEFGDPPKVVKLVEEDLQQPNDDEVVVQMLVASINPADINTVQGTYPVKPDLPGVPGHEGVGKISHAGKNVKNVSVGDLVIPNIENFGTWRTHTVVNSKLVYKIPSDVPLVEVSGIASNVSTAYRMLRDFVDLKSGDCIVQNGGNSAAGQNVIQFCKAWGINSINVVRDRPDIADLKAYLKGLGATYVLTEEEFRTTELIKSKEVPAPKLALNCVGGKSASELMRKLGSKGIIVTYGGMSREPVIIPTSLLIFKDISARGYWMTRWTKENRESDERKRMLSEIMDLIKAGKIKAPAHKLVPFDQYLEALENTSSSKGFAGTKYIIDFRL